MPGRPRILLINDSYILEVILFIGIRKNHVLYCPQQCALSNSPHASDMSLYARENMGCLVLRGKFDRIHRKTSNQLNSWLNLTQKYSHLYWKLNVFGDRVVSFCLIYISKFPYVYVSEPMDYEKVDG